jgi:hypothetical protein
MSETTLIKTEDLQPGDWILMKYGSDDRDWYIVSNDGSNIVLGQPRWCSDTLLSFPVSEMKQRGFSYLGRGRKKWYWPLIPWKDVAVPYTKWSLR